MRKAILLLSILFLSPFATAQPCDLYVRLDNLIPAGDCGYCNDGWNSCEMEVDMFHLKPVFQVPYCGLKNHDYAGGAIGEPTWIGTYFPYLKTSSRGNSDAYGVKIEIWLHESYTGGDIVCQIKVTSMGWFKYDALYFMGAAYLNNFPVTIYNDYYYCVCDYDWEKPHSWIATKYGTANITLEPYFMINRCRFSDEWKQGNLNLMNLKILLNDEKEGIYRY